MFSSLILHEKNKTRQEANIQKRMYEDTDPDEISVLSPHRSNNDNNNKRGSRKLLGQ